MTSEQIKAGIHVVALAGGVGGARLAQGLAALLAPEQLKVIINTGDDFEHLGMTICPDVDTVTYTLAGLSNPETGWGIAGDTFNCLDGIKQLDGPAWFQIGDRDLATHLMRTKLLRDGLRLTEVTHHISKKLGVQHALLPMSDTPIRTYVRTEQGDMDFQTYFVGRAYQPAVKGIFWKGLEDGKPSPEVATALQMADIIILCPSNPFVSIDPILQLPGVRAWIKARPTIAVSPILGGKAVKGPAAKMFTELGAEPSSVNVARHYLDILSGFILDEIDSNLIAAVNELGIEARAFPTLMPDLNERTTVARHVLEFAVELYAKGKTAT